MAFMDKLKDFTGTVTTKSAEVAQKAKDMAEVASLNSRIKAENDGINAAYQAIGKIIFDEQRDDADSPFYEQIQSVKRKMLKIAELEKEISNIKGTKKCSNCGQEIGILAETCPKCNTQCVETEIIVDKICPACGKAAADEDVFCLGCGRKL